MPLFFLMLVTNESMACLNRFMSYRPDRDSRSQSFRKGFVQSVTRESEARLLAAVLFEVIK